MPTCNTPTELQHQIAQQITMSGWRFLDIAATTMCPSDMSRIPSNPILLLYVTLEFDLHTEHSVHIQILNSINYFQKCVRCPVVFWKELFHPTFVDMWPRVGSGRWVGPASQLHMCRPRKAQNIQGYRAPILGFPHGALYAIAFSV